VLGTSLYADDAALFIRPTVQDVTNTQQILAAFGAATGLNTNMQKSAPYMIHIEPMTTIFQGVVPQLPTKYSGLPLHIDRTRRADEQAIVDKM
jgi:hypothetical protein